MSYVVTIKRPPGKPPLVLHDIETLVQQDPSLSRRDGDRMVWFDPESQQELSMNFEDHCLWTDGIRGDSIGHVLGKLRSIAGRLDARVLGEEGEDLTEETPTDPVSTAQALAGLVLFIASLPFLLLLFLVRLPWILWKLSRTLK